jgi:hypothetical protein
VTDRITRRELEAHLILRAAEDESFRRELLDNPRDAVERELQLLTGCDVRLRHDLAVRIHEEPVGAFELVLPARPDAASDQDSLTFLWEDVLAPVD